MNMNLVNIFIGNNYCNIKMHRNIELLFILLFLKLSYLYATEVNVSNTTIKTENLNQTLGLNETRLITANKVEVNIQKLNQSRRSILNVDGRRKKNKSSRSTSSDSDDESDSNAKSAGTSQTDDDGGFIGSDTSSSSSDSKDKDIPKSSPERKGWRKWHRKCTQCPEDDDKKWKDPSINWICGAYQHARRSFKSTCSMYLRNCQDGTMFVKIHDHRCADDDPNAVPYLKHGTHFMYDYKVSIFSSDSESSKSSESSMDNAFENKEMYNDYLDNVIFKYLDITKTTPGDVWKKQKLI